jgi:hypothetical protein
MNRDQLYVAYYTWQISQLHLHGCSDGHCCLRSRVGGMHTNGGCWCFEVLADLGLELAAHADTLKNRRGLKPIDLPIEEIIKMLETNA